jgi:putative sterol carrier protein
MYGAGRKCETRISAQGCNGNRPDRIFLIDRAGQSAESVRMRRWLMFLLVMPWVTLQAHVPGHPAGASPSPSAAQSNAEPDPTSPDEVFAQMQHSFRAEKARGLHLRYQFDFSDPQGGKYWVLINDGACSMGQGTIDKPDVTFNCTGSDWVKLSNGTLGGFQAFFSGRLKIAGSQFTAHRLDELFP